MPERLMTEKPNLHATVPLTIEDGRTVCVRHMRRSDAELLERMFYRLSPEALWRRFFVPVDHIDSTRVHSESARLATIDYMRETALIAVEREDGREECLAVARFTMLEDDPDCAEASVIVRDDFQGVGLGRQIFDLLIQVGLARGIRHMVLLTHADNIGMIGLVHSLGLPYSGKYSSGLYEIDLQLTDGEKPYFPFSAPHHTAA